MFKTALKMIKTKYVLNVWKYYDLKKNVVLEY